MAKPKEIKNNGSNEPIFWMKGDGMIRREHNIDEVKKLILSGLSYQKIIRLSRKHFQSRTINEYYEIAFDEVNNSDEITESATDYMKRRKAEKEQLTKKCKNCGKPIRNDLTFCSSQCMRDYKRKKGDSKNL